MNLWIKMCRWDKGVLIWECIVYFCVQQMLVVCLQLWFIVILIFILYTTIPLPLLTHPSFSSPSFSPPPLNPCLPFPSHSIHINKPIKMGNTSLPPPTFLSVIRNISCSNVFEYINFTPKNYKHTYTIIWNQ